jgi:hypothetical protein
MIPLGLLIGALVVPANASEKPPDIPPSEQTVRSAIEEYVRVSLSELERLDSLASGTKLCKREWRSHCTKAQNALGDARDAVQRVYRSRRQPVPKHYNDWLANETECWKRITTIGRELIEEHDRILDAIHALDFDQKRVKAVLHNIEACALGVDRAVEILTRLISAPLADTYADLSVGLRDGARMSPGAYLLGKVLVTEAREIKDFRKDFSSDKYKRRVRDIIAKKIDPDQRGQFVLREKLWERKLSALADQYDKRYREYVTASKPLVEAQVFVRLEYLKGWTAQNVYPKFQELLRDAKEAVEKRKDSDG